MLSADVNAALDQRPDLRLVKLADAAHDNWTHLGEWRRRLTAAPISSASFILLSNSRQRPMRPTVRTICGDERSTRTIATCYGMSPVTSSG